ncbi:hypothetical protein ACLKA6_006138 [Drosophila palustris]
MARAVVRMRNDQKRIRIRIRVSNGEWRKRKRQQRGTSNTEKQTIRRKRGEWRVEQASISKCAEQDIEDMLAFDA